MSRAKFGTYSGADTATLQLTATPPSAEKLEISPCTKGKLNVLFVDPTSPCIISPQNILHSFAYVHSLAYTIEAQQ
ncbi:hypothetical protein HZ326_22570 [Fusarium oxysporum f. sp. albedinis]|nr:hypothetical protein HZ326_22570 [Fusarium oxysporum f. sp. albedinis]